jgi:hypothetical protein
MILFENGNPSDLITSIINNEGNTTENNKKPYASVLVWTVRTIRKR